MTLLSRFEKWDPFEELNTLRNRMDRVFAKFGDELDQPIMAGNWMPTTDVYETKDALVLKTELPGIEEKDIDIELQSNVLTITGERKKEEKIDEKSYQRFERRYGNFVRSFTLPPNVNLEKITAAFDKGLLEIQIPKKEEAMPKKVKLAIRKALAPAA